MKNFENGIDWTFKTVEAEQGKTNVNFDMSNVMFSCENKELTISNEQFEILIAEYIRRQKELKELNI